MNDTMTLHLVRHASHGLLPHTLAGRMPGVALDAAGRAQARRLAARFAQHPIAAVVSSPVQRALETAASIAAALHLPARTDDGLDEIDFGTWSGRPFDDLAPDPAWQRWNTCRSLAACPGGETMHQAQSRALLALGRLRHAYPGAAVVAVSHADVLKSMLAAILGMSLDHLHRFVLDPASCSTVVLFDGGARVDAVNLPC